MVDTATILRQCDVIQSALDAIRAECQSQPLLPPPSFAIDRGAVIDEVISSPVPEIDWQDRGEAPPRAWDWLMPWCFAIG